MSFGIPVRNGLGIGLTPSTTLSSGVRGTRPAMFLDFLNTTSLSGMVTFTRASTATFTGSNGLIQTAAINAPRFDYDPVTLAAKGLLIEEQRTNLALYSEQFDNAAWTKSAVTITANATAAPDGTSTADKLTPDVTLATHFAGQTVTTTAVAHTYSAYLKAGGYSWAILYAAGVNQGVYFDLANGVVGSSFIGAPTSSSITPVGNGWYRCSITFTATTGTAARVYASSANTVSTFAGDGTSGIFVYGAQLEAGAFATSYIPTVASTVTRSADVATMTGTNFSSWYNQTQGTFVVDFTPDEGLTTGTTRVLTVSQAGAAARVIDVSFLGTNWVNYNGTNTTVIGAASVTSTPQRIATAYASANYGYTLNGGTVATDASALVNSPTQMAIGHTVNVNQLNGHIRQIAYYNTRLPNATLQTLTEIPGAYSASYLAVAGGASGGRSNGGGGGAGGYLASTATIIAGAVYTIAVGGGGAAASGTSQGSDGSNSTLSGSGVSVTSIGGGGGGTQNGTNTGRNGGSSGGGSYLSGAGGTATSGQGFAGGTGSSASGNGGGGGGASAVGISADAGSNQGNGGDGLASSITGTSVTRGGGGGAGGLDRRGLGGAGGGGNGAHTLDAVAGTANTGGGGGGGSSGLGTNSGAGGSGVVILSVPTAKYTGTTTGSPTVTTSGANTILTFTSSGSYTA